MSDCCNASEGSVKAAAGDAAPCPRCGALAKGVGATTLMHHLKAPDNQHLPSQAFFFCPGVHCDLVYFTLDGRGFETDSVRWAVGQKSTLPDRTLCYCFDVSLDRVEAEIERTGQSASKAFVMEQTRLKHCACEIRNPSGRCCLASFPK